MTGTALLLVPSSLVEDLHDLSLRSLEGLEEMLNMDFETSFDAQ